MNLKDAHYPIVALGRNAVYVYGAFDAVSKCYRGLIAATYGDTTFVDGDGRCWKCEGAKALRSLIPAWKRLFGPDFVEVELSLSAPEILADVEVAKQMISKAIQRTQRLALRTDNRVFECVGSKQVMTQVLICIRECGTVAAIIDGISRIVEEHG